MDVCADGCGGIFFDNQELNEFNNCTAGLDDIKKLLEGKNFQFVDESKVRVCPACNTNMAKTKARGVQIDTCYNCGGIFLDHGEFDLVKSSFKKHQKVETVNNLSTADLEQIVRGGKMGGSTLGCRSIEGGAIFWRILQILATPRYRL